MAGNTGSSRNGYGKPPARRGTICSIYVKMPTGITATTVSALSGEGALWCLVSSAAGGQYLSWQFTIGLCATLARSRNERPDTFACFLWPAQYRMGRAYSLQKLNGRVVAGGFAVGKTPALSARRNRRMPVKELGFSLLEVLIAMAISSVLLLGGSTLSACVTA